MYDALIQSHQSRLILKKFLAVWLSIPIRCTGTLHNRFKNQLPAYDSEDSAA